MKGMKVRVWTYWSPLWELALYTGDEDRTCSYTCEVLMSLQRCHLLLQRGDGTLCSSMLCLQ